MADIDGPEPAGITRARLVSSDDRAVSLRIDVVVLAGELEFLALSVGLARGCSA